MFFCDSGFAWQVDGVRLNATESYFVSVAFWRFEADRITERQAYLSGRNSPLPRVYGKMQTEVSDKLAGAIIYMKRDQIVKGQVTLDEALMKKLVQI